MKIRITAVSAFLAVPLLFFQAQAAGGLLITEIQIAGEDTDNDFVEIYNPSVSSLDISGYKLKKRTQSGTSDYSVRVFPSGSLIGGSGYFLWANSGNGFSQSVGADVSSTQTLAKNNSVALTDSAGIVLDAVAWGSSLVNPFVEGNPFIPNPEAGQSLARKFNAGCRCYLDSGDNSADFVLSGSATPGQANGFYQDGSTPEPSSTSMPTSEPSVDSSPTPSPAVFSESPSPNPTPTPESSKPPSAPVSTPETTPTTIQTSTATPTPSSSVPAATPRPVYSRQVVISEFLPNPVGDDSQNEWLEIYNESGEAIDLSGWKLADLTSKYVIPAVTVINPHSYLVFTAPVTKLNINNDGETLSLYDPNGDLVFQIAYDGKAPEGQSLNRMAGGQWLWSDLPTPGSRNVVKKATPAVKSNPPSPNLTPSPAKTILSPVFSPAPSKTPAPPFFSSPAISLLPARIETVGPPQTANSESGDQPVGNLQAAADQSVIDHPNRNPAGADQAAAVRSGIDWFNLKLVGAAALVGFISLAGIFFLKRFLV